MASGPCAGVRGARPGRARSLEVARCDRHRHRVRNDPEPRLAGAARRFLGLAERCAAVLLGGARFRQAVPALRRVPLGGAARERRVRARGVLAALPGGARLDAPGSLSYRRRGGASRFHRLGRPHRARARGAAGARQPRRAERRARRAAAGSDAACRDRRPVRRRARPGFPLLDLDRAGGARPRGRRGPPRLPGMARPPCPAFLGGQPHRRRRALDQLAACASRALTRALQGMVDFDLAAAGSARRERVLLSFHRKLVRVAGLAARGLGAVGDAAALGRAAAFRAGVRLARHPARRGVHGAAAGCQPARAARAPCAARFARRADAATGGRRRARLVRRHHLRLLRRADLAGVHGDDDRRSAQGGRQLRPRRARVHAAIQPALLPFRGCADARLALHRAVRRARAVAQRGALGRRRSAALGNVRDAVDALGRLPEELPLGGARAALQGPGGRWLHRGEAARRAAGGGARLPCRPAAARVRPAEARGVPAAPRPGQPEARARRAGSGLGKARRRRPPRRQGRALPPLPPHQMNTRSPTECPAWAQLLAHAEAPGVRYDFSRQRVDAMTLRLLANLADERGFPEWREALLSGKPVNSTEKRAAWHTALRAGASAPAEVRETLARMRTMATRLRAERQIKRIVNLGTGGSDLGPRLLADALGDGALEVRFAANADPRDLERALEGADPKTTLFVVVSKTFTTPETMSNAAAAKKWGGKVFYAVTSNVEAAKQFGASEILPVWDWVGGRFSVWSAVGFAAACAMGFDGFREFLAGAHDIDRHFAQAPLEKNVPVLMALIGVWNGNFLGASTHAVLPYSSALRLLPAYLQQLEMESNGKRVDREGRVLNYSTVPVVWGMEGTVSQHSFHQLLHQGTQIVPADFIDLSLEKVLS